jgi:hypothetical protein
MRLSITSLSTLFLLVPLMGCPPAEDADKDTADTAADTDTDTDTDTEPGPVGDVPDYSFSGSVTVTSSLNGEVVCDADATLTGTNYTGDCEGCDFAVEIDDTITRDDSTADCSYFSKYSFIEGGGYYDLIMAGASEYAGTYYDYANALLVGYGVSYESYGYTYDYPGPYFGSVAYDGSPYTSWTRTGDDVSWSLTYSSTYDDYVGAYYSACGTVEDSTATEGPAGEGGASTVDCDGAIADVWTFVADGTGPVTIAIDTTSDETAFDAQAWVNSPDGCTEIYADDSFDCTFPPPKYQCPAFDLESPEAGTYEVVVLGYAKSCAGSEAAYELRVGGAASDVTLAHDDIASYSIESFTLDIGVTGSGTLTAE